MSGTYDPLLVTLSVLVAIFASYTALDLAGRVTVSGGAVRRGWLGRIRRHGHRHLEHALIRMLAFRMPGMPIAYDLPLWLLSVAIAIAALS